MNIRPVMRSQESLPHLLPSSRLDANVELPHNAPRSQHGRSKQDVNWVVVIGKYVVGFGILAAVIYNYWEPNAEKGSPGLRDLLQGPIAWANNDARIVANADLQWMVKVTAAMAGGIILGFLLLGFLPQRRVDRIADRLRSLPKARGLFEDGELIEVFVDSPLEECERRDVKGLYAKARRGELKNFTGIDSDYEPPEAPDVHLRTIAGKPEVCVDQIAKFLIS